MSGRDPFRIDDPALVSFSGGRTSGYMLWRILQSHGGTLPSGIRVVFANTGKEMPETLDFVRDCGERWSVEIVWVQYREAERPSDRWERVTHETAARHGEPFKALIDRRGMLPNPVARFCTQDLKILAMQRWADANGVDRTNHVVGLRADEPMRVARMRARVNGGKDGRDVLMPLAEAGITKGHVSAFWLRQNFGLRLPSVNGVTPLGNCDLCYLKSAATISGIMRDQPDLARWWIAAEAEAETRAFKPNGAIFRQDRPSYAQMFDAVQRQGGFDFGERDEIVDCFCGDAA
jgi:3'-phosphoadenosine 5'-phosphosulfate sulfotransferase (PAPS reductase)/FAD synthetase